MKFPWTSHYPLDIPEYLWYIKRLSDGKVRSAFDIVAIVAAMAITTTTTITIIVIVITVTLAIIVIVTSIIFTIPE